MHSPDCYTGHMQKFSQKYAIIAPLEKFDEGSEFPSSNWPLHTTIADTFAIDLDSTDFLKRLAESLANQQAVVTTAGEDDYFGARKHTQVTLLDKSKQLLALHYVVVALLKDAGAVFNEPHYTEEGYKPHVTVQHHARLHKGSFVRIEEVSLIDMFPHGDPYLRRVIKTIRLSDRESP